MFGVVNCERKVGVDILQGGTVRMSTDDFFAQNQETFDIIFIDACHHHNQVLKDFNGSLKVLNAGGVIIMHDCNPANVGREIQSKCGTAWRAFVKHVRTQSNLDAIVGDYDNGVGIVRVAPNQKIISIVKEMDEFKFGDLEQNRDQYLRLHSWEDVQAWL